MKIAPVSYNCSLNYLSNSKNGKSGSNNLNLRKSNSITSFQGINVKSPVICDFLDTMACWIFKNNIFFKNRIVVQPGPIIKNSLEGINTDDAGFIFSSKINRANVGFCKFLSGCLQKYPELKKIFLFQSSLPPNFIIKKSEDACAAQNNLIFNQLLKISDKKETLKILNSSLYDDEAINWMGIVPKNLTSKSADFMIDNLYKMLCLRQRLDSRPYPKWHIWASRANLLTDYATCEIKNGASFDSVLESIAQGYSYITKNDLRGTKRFENNLVTYFGDKSYREYTKRFEAFIYKQLKSPFEDMDITHVSEAKARDKNMRYLIHPDVSSVDSALKHAKEYYDNLEEVIYKHKSGQKLSLGERYYASEQIAAIHYLLANVVPFYRGSAGICMILTNALKKSAGLPLAPVKRNTALDLEAYCNTLPEYKEKWLNFFDCRPEN